MAEGSLSGILADAIAEYIRTRQISAREVERAIPMYVSYPPSSKVVIDVEV